MYKTTHGLDPVYCCDFSRVLETRVVEPFNAGDRCSVPFTCFSGLPFLASPSALTFYNMQAGVEPSLTFEALTSLIYSIALFHCSFSPVDIIDTFYKTIFTYVDHYALVKHSMFLGRLFVVTYSSSIQ